MKVLVVGNGGREHAITWKVALSPEVDKIYVAPGNAGTLREPKVENVDINPMDFDGLIRFAKSKQIDLTIVGPEAPLVAGLQDAFAQAGLPCFGPNQQAAQLEASKSFTKDFLVKYNIPTAKSQTFTDYEEAKAYVESQEMPIVIKADGLCGGKGVVIAQTQGEAIATLDSMLNQHQFFEASQKVVVEAFLVGEEASFIVLTDGTTCYPFASSQDHKARDDGDKGPNTGGMGAYSPAPIVDHDLHKTIMETIIQPTLEGLKQEGIVYQGFLYAGLMITESGPKVLEFNCRLGDPEAQPLLMRLDSDLTELCLATLSGSLGAHQPPQWKPEVALGVVMAASGYPQNVRIEDPIVGLNDLRPDPKYKIFHSGTKVENGTIVTNGGRVLCVTGLGDSVQAAKQKAYEIANKIQWDGAFYRTDIGDKAIAVEKEGA